MPTWVLRVSRNINLGRTTNKDSAHGQRACIGTNPGNSAYYGGAWVTCMFEPESVFQTD